MIRRWLAKLLKLEEPAKPLQESEEEEPDYMGYTMIDEETGFTLSVLMVCGCGYPVVKAGPDDDKSFWCEHCDRVCLDKPCEACIAHFLFDAEAVRAEAERFKYEEYDEEDE